MKSSILLVALGAGVIGGLLGAAGVYLMDDQPTAERVQVAADSYDDSDVRADVRRNADDLIALRKRMSKYEMQLDAATIERESLVEENTKLKDKVEELETAKPVASGGATETAGSDPELKADVDAAVEKALEAEREKEKAKRAEAERKETDGWVNDGKKKIIATLDEKLSLTQYQRERITGVLDNLNDRMHEMLQRGGEAKETGEEFDWETEWNAVFDETEEEIRAELGSAQLPTFDEVLGESGLQGVAFPGK